MNKKLIYKFLAALIFVILVHSLIIYFYKEKEIEITRQTALVKLGISEYPIFADNLSFEGLSDSLEQSLKYYNKLPKTRTFDFGNTSYTVDHLIKSLENFLVFLNDNTTGNDINRYIQENFMVYKTTGGNDDRVLFTGYYEPTYQGSLVKSKEFFCPLYTVPDDLLKIDLSLFSDKIQVSLHLKSALRLQYKLLLKVLFFLLKI